MQWKMGDRPPRWHRMSQEERDAVGLGTARDFHAASRAYRARFYQGGDIWRERRRAAGELVFDWLEAQQPPHTHVPPVPCQWCGSLRKPTVGGCTQCGGPL